MKFIILRVHLFIGIFIVSVNFCIAQNVGVGTNNPAAALDVVSTVQGFAMPRMTTIQRIGIVSPIAGLQVYDTQLKGFYYYDGTKWDCSSTPAGTVNYFGSNSVPNGYLACDGAVVSRAVYPELFAAIGILYGVGDGVTTFQLPDFRSEFIRSADNGRGVLGGHSTGTFQNYDWKGFFMTNTGVNTYSYVHNDVWMGKTTAVYTGNMFTGGWSAPSAAIGTKWDDSEIRPRNVALLTVIKY